MAGAEGLEPFRTPNTGHRTPCHLGCLLLHALLHLGEAGADAGLDVSAGELDTGDRRLASGEAEEGEADAIEILLFGLDPEFHGASDGSEEAVGEENS